MSKAKGRNPWDRLPDETAKAYGAFCTYLDLGPTRSCDKAFAQANPGNQRKGRPAEWHRWSKKYEWVKRSEAWDVHEREVEEAARLERLRELARKRGDAEFEAFEALLKDVRASHELLNKVRAMPVTDVEVIEQTKDGQQKRKRVRGIDLAKVAQFMKEIRETWRELANGPREAEPSGPANPATGIEWDKPDGIAA